MDFNMFSAETLGRSASQHVKDATVAAAASFSMLFLQQIVMKHAVNDFQTLGALLLAVFVLQLAVTLVTSASNGKKATVVAITIDAHTLSKLLANGARIFVQCWIRADALHHFGFLFAFLLENVDVLLLQPLKDALLLNAKGHGNGSSSSSSNNTWLLVLIGYVLVAGVDAYEYGSLLHTFLLIALALAMQELHNRTPEAKIRVSTSPQFHLISLLSACAMSVPLALFIGSWRMREEAAFNEREGVEAMSTSGWTLCLFAAAAFQTASLYFVRNNDSITSSRSRWMALMACSATGLVSSLVVSASQDDWLRCAADSLASLVIIYAQFAQFRHVSKTQYGSREEELDMYRSTVNETTSASIARILSVLWAKDDSRKILLFLSVNISYMFVELAVGFWTNSLGLIGDAGHMFFDNGALIIGLIAAYIGKLPADSQYTYGYGRVEVLSGFLNSIFLLFISFHLMAEASSRFFDPPEVSTENLLLTSTVGLVVNIVGLVWFHDQVHGHGHSHGGEGGCGGGGKDKAHGHSHGHGHAHGKDEHHQNESSGNNGGSNSNMYGVYLHVLADTLGSVGVIVSSLLIEYKGWHVADPLSSAMISLLIFGSTLPLLKDTLLQLLQRVPKEMERDIAKTLDEVRASVSGLLEIQQWHFWRHVNEVCVGTLHVLVDESVSEQLVMHQIREIFKRHLEMDNFLSIQVAKNGAGTGGYLTGDHELPHALKHLDHDHHHDHSHNDHHHDDDHHHHVMSTFENPAGDDALRFACHSQHQHFGFGSNPSPPPAATASHQNQWKFNQQQCNPVTRSHGVAAAPAPVNGAVWQHSMPAPVPTRLAHSHYEQQQHDHHGHSHGHGHSYGHHH